MHRFRWADLADIELRKLRYLDARLIWFAVVVALGCGNPNDSAENDGLDPRLQALLAKLDVARTIAEAALAGVEQNRALQSLRAIQTHAYPFDSAKTLQDLDGGTFVYDLPQDRYVPNDAPVEGPPEGVRFVLYAADGGRLVVPLEEIGYVDLFELAPATDTTFTLRAVVDGVTVAELLTHGRLRPFSTVFGLEIDKRAANGWYLADGRQAKLGMRVDRAIDPERIRTLDKGETFVVGVPDVGEVTVNRGGASGSMGVWIVLNEPEQTSVVGFLQADNGEISLDFETIVRFTFMSGAWVFTFVPTGEVVASETFDAFMWLFTVFHALQWDFGNGVLAPTTSVFNAALVDGSRITVMTRTSGADWDSDGYTVTLECVCFRRDDFTTSEFLSVNDTVTVRSLPLDHYWLRLGSVAPNCVVVGDNPRFVDAWISSAFVEFDISCSSVNASG